MHGGQVGTCSSLIGNIKTIPEIEISPSMQVNVCYALTQGTTSCVVQKLPDIYVKMKIK